jgi:hypothetical protein
VSRSPEGPKSPLGKNAPRYPDWRDAGRTTFGQVPCPCHTTSASSSRGRSEPMVTKRKRLVHEFQRRLTPGTRRGSRRVAAWKTQGAFSLVRFEAFYQTFYQLPHETPQNRVKQKDAGRVMSLKNKKEGESGRTWRRAHNPKGPLSKAPRNVIRREPIQGGSGGWREMRARKCVQY